MHIGGDEDEKQIAATCRDRVRAPGRRLCSIEKTKPRISCAAAQCDAKVTVSDSGGRCEPDYINPIDLRTGGGGPKMIKWTLDTPGYEFSREPFKFAILFETDPLDQFQDASVSKDGRTLTIRFNANPRKADEPQSFKYAITVRKTDERKTFCKTLDPWLLN